MTRRARRWIAPALAAAAICTIADPARARTPLPTVEVVQERPRRVRFLDVRGPLQFGWGYSSLWRTPVYQVMFESQFSVVELSDTTWLHVTLAENGMIGAYPRRHGERRPGLLGADVGVGLSRYATGGPGLFATVQGGPRWTLGRERLAPDGAGILGRVDVYPFYRSIPELVKMRHQWFRKYVVSGVHLWVSARYDYTTAGRGNTFAGGIGMDLGRTLLLPVVEAATRRSSR